jgi:hypothetical protein
LGFAGCGRGSSKTGTAGFAGRRFAGAGAGAAAVTGFGFAATDDMTVRFAAFRSADLRAGAFFPAFFATFAGFTRRVTFFGLATLRGFARLTALVDAAGRLTGAFLRLAFAFFLVAMSSLPAVRPPRCEKEIPRREC